MSLILRCFLLQLLFGQLVCYHYFGFCIFMSYYFTSCNFIPAVQSFYFMSCNFIPAFWSFNFMSCNLMSHNIAGPSISCPAFSVNPSSYVLKSLVVSLVLPRTYDGSATLTAQPRKQLDRLQFVMNAAARLVFSVRKYDHITPLLRDLHWLRTSQRI